MSAEYLYCIRILITHPTLTSDEISDEFNLEPDVSHCVGQPRRGPKGNLWPGVWPDTKWSISEVRNGERHFFTRLGKLLDRFSLHRDFMRKIAETGGETLFIIELPGGRMNVGDTLTEQTVAKLADLKGSLGLEVYPIMNPMVDEHIWADDP